MLQKFDDHEMYESLPHRDWWDTTQWHSIRYRWYLVAASYKNAADILVDGSPHAVLMGLDRLYIACPIMFLYRHYLELELKALLLDLQASGHLELHSRQHLMQKHYLMPLWRELKESLTEIDREVSGYETMGSDGLPIYDTIEKRIRELDELDPQSFNFRYPSDRKGEEQTLAQLPNANEMSHVRDVFDVIAQYFDGVETWVHEEKNGQLEYP